MKDIRKCNTQGCTVEPIRSGLCEFHKWERYRKNVTDKFERKKRILDEKITARQIASDVKYSTSSNISLGEMRILAKKQRIDNFFYLFSIGYTVRQIAEQNGISRQRVFQILDEHPEFPSTKERLRESKKEDTAFCEGCRNLFVKKRPTRKFCNMDCKRAWNIKNSLKHNISPEEKRRIQNEMTKSYYHRVLKHKPEHKIKTKARNDRAEEIRKKDREVRLQKTREALSQVDPILLRNIKG